MRKQPTAKRSPSSCFSVLVLSLGLGLAWPVAGFALDWGGDSGKDCPAGQTWSETDGKCVPTRSDKLVDQERTQRGRRLARAGKYEEAIAVLQTVRRADDPLALTYLGYSYRKLGHVDLGIAYYRKALAVDPDNVDTREYLGEGYVAAGRIDRARVQLAEIEKRCGTGCEAYQSLRAVIAGDATE
jgi:tetratricopeptide (TPR) repeat protein